MTPTTATAPPAPPPANRRRAKPGKTILLHYVDWETYEKLVEAFGDRRNPRMVYDRGDLQIMAPSNEHEFDTEALGQLVGVLTRAFGLPYRPGGQTTLKRQSALKGLEADRCYWIANAAALAGVRRLDLTVHPPPDLAIEVDVTSSSLDKLPVFAGIGVPELWRLDRSDLRFYRLGPDGKYVEVSTSPTFPGLTPADLMRFQQQVSGAVDQNVAILPFEAWAQQLAAAQAPPPPAP